MSVFSDTTQARSMKCPQKLVESFYKLLFCVMSNNKNGNSSKLKGYNIFLLMSGGSFFIALLCHYSPVGSTVRVVNK